MLRSSSSARSSAIAAGPREDALVDLEGEVELGGDRPQLLERLEEPRPRELDRVRVQEDRSAGRCAAAASSTAFRRNRRLSSASAPDALRDLEQLERALRQLGVPAAAERLVGGHRAPRQEHDGLEDHRHLAVAQQLAQLAGALGEAVGQRRPLLDARRRGPLVGRRRGGRPRRRSGRGGTRSRRSAATSPSPSAASSTRARFRNVPFLLPRSRSRRPARGRRSRRGPSRRSRRAGPARGPGGGRCGRAGCGSGTRRRVPPSATVSRYQPASPIGGPRLPVALRRSRRAPPWRTSIAEPARR